MAGGAKPLAWQRRGVLAAAMGALGGCGFRPLYAPDGPSGTGVGADLGSVYVALLPERTGQLLRQALQRRFEGTGASQAKRFELSVAYSIAGEGIGIQQDNSTTRLRLVANASWTLKDLTPKQAVVTTGAARSVDGLNILNQQYFAADLETETVQRRLAEAVATQIAQQLAVYFRRQANNQAPA